MFSDKDLVTMIEVAKEIRALVKANKPVPPVLAEDLAELVLALNEEEQD